MFDGLRKKLSGFVNSIVKKKDEEVEEPFDEELSIEDKQEEVKQTKKDIVEKKEERKKEEPKEKKEEKVRDEKPKEKKTPKEVGPRPDFKFSAGTSSASIMEVFVAISKASKGAGVSMKDIQDAAVKAKVKSNNVPGRVATTVRYAMKPEGGAQIEKVGSVYYLAGEAPKE